MKTNQQIYWLVFILITLSIVSTATRNLVYTPDKSTADDQFWSLKIDIDTIETDELANIRITPPLDTRHIRTIERNISHSDFKIRNTSSEKKSRRSIHAQALTTGDLNLSLEFLLHKSRVPFNLITRSSVSLSTQQREVYLGDDKHFEIQSYSVQKRLKELARQQPQQNLLIKEIFSYLKKIPMTKNTSVLNVSKILTLKKATTLDRSLAMVALCRAAGIPARLVSGLILRDNSNAGLHHWVEVYEDGQWSSYDIHYGYQQKVPDNYLPLRKNASDNIEVIAGKSARIQYNLTLKPDLKVSNTAQEDSFINIFDLSRLNFDDREQLALLLLLPFGALITTLFRHLIGANSYGVFTPSLLALAIVYADLISTLVVFIVISTLAIVGRSFFPSTITRAPRLSIIFTLVALIMAFSVSIMSHFGISQNDSVILLPIIILTSLVDRLYRTIEENGINIAIRRMIWTIIITLTCLPIIQFETLGHLVLQYPEIHLTTLGLFLLISTYKGKYIINLPVIKLLAEPDTVINKKKTLNTPKK